ncbi:MauE/DoxX family redox-associated membrane protein [Micromonosporaceae bacterium B7E4]
MQYLATVVRCLIGVVFLVSFASKVARRNAFQGFTASIRGMRVLPSRLTTPAALLVVAGEAAACLLLAVPVRAANVAGLMVASGLLVTFSIGIVVSLRRGVQAPCRCFGASTTPLRGRHVVRNVGLIGACTVGAAAMLTPTAPAQAGGVAVAMATGLLLGGLLTVLDDIVELFGSTSGQATGERGRR